MKSEWFLSHHW